MAKTAEDIIQGIDFPQLKEQKSSLLESISKIEKLADLGESEAISKVNADCPKYDDTCKKVRSDIENLKGVVNLIDSIQDFAVDELGVDENEVFNLTGEDDN